MLLTGAEEKRKRKKKIHPITTTEEAKMAMQPSGKLKIILFKIFLKKVLTYSGEGGIINESLT